jgi:DNA-binding transcriptional LysR family regulator
MTRHVDGIRLTPEGVLVLEAAKRMEEASFGLDRTLSRTTSALGGEVRFAVTECARRSSQSFPVAPDERSNDGAQRSRLQLPPALDAVASGAGD